MACERLSEALDIAKEHFDCDPGYALAWCSKRKKVWVKENAAKHRPNFDVKLSTWRSGGGKYLKKEAVTMIYFYGEGEELCFFLTPSWNGFSSNSLFF